MIEILNPHLDRRGKRGGKSKLSGEDRLLVVLEYWREYRTQFHIGTSWNICESAVCRLICKVEKLLMDSGKFRLSGKKQLDRQADNWQVIVVEHVNRKLKIFRILDVSAMPRRAERYRNRRKRFGPRFNLISTILNFELASPS